MADLLTPIRTARRHTIARIRAIDTSTAKQHYGPHDRQVLSTWAPLTLRPDSGWPTLVMLHGGGWIEGSRLDFACLAPRIAQHRILCAAIDYRLAPSSPWPAQQEDTLRAITFLQQHMGADPSRIALWGHSAGGHVALMTAAAEPSLAAVIALGSPCSLEKLPRTPVGVFSDDQLRSASPLNALSPEGTPILLVHGAKDRVCAVSQARALAQALPRRCRLREVRGGNHGLSWPPIACRDAKQDAVRWVSERLR